MTNLRYVKVEAWLKKEPSRVRPFGSLKPQSAADAWRLMIKWRTSRKGYRKLTARSCRSEKKTPDKLCFQQPEHESRLQSVTLPRLATHWQVIRHNLKDQFKFKISGHATLVFDWNLYSTPVQHLTWKWNFLEFTGRCYYEEHML